MSYRVRPKKPHNNNRSAHDISTRGEIHVENGAIAHIAIPCYYYEIKLPEEKEMKFYGGNPALDFTRYYIDDIKNINTKQHMIDMDKLIPIHLLDEEQPYENVIIKLDTDETILTSGSIDIYDDWVVRITIESQSELGEKETLRIPMTIYIEAEEKSGYPARRDIIYRGKLIVHPGKKV